MNTDCSMVEVVIKNTFIEIEHVLPKPVQRRCASVPSSTRLNKGADNSGEEQAPEVQKIFKASAADASFNQISDASTDSGSTSDDESIDSSPTNTVSSEFPAAPDMMAVAHMQQMVLVAVPMSSVVTVEQPPVKVTKLSTQAKTFTPGSTQLSTQAKTFAPGCCLQQKPPGSKLNANSRKRCAKFRWQCQQVILAAQEALAALIFVQSVELVAQKSSLSLDARMRPEYSEKKEQALSKAKQALLDAAEQSQGVYVLGYRSKPFLATPDGFFVILGVMTCSKDACWDTFCYGCCRNEGACTLQHPVYQVPVYVNLTPAGC